MAIFIIIQSIRRLITVEDGKSSIPAPSTSVPIKQEQDVIEIKPGFMGISFDLSPPPLVEDPERFYRSGEK